jgi:hypothetical protein
MMGDSALQDGKESTDPVPGLYLLASMDIFKMLETVRFLEVVYSRSRVSKI